VAPNRVTATFEVVPPLFLGGADPASTAELRAPSIKGTLRFWWRALAWGRHAGEPEVLKKIQAEEARLFGAAGTESIDGGGTAGQASFLLRVHSIDGSKRIPKGETLKHEGRLVGAGMRYFGYGLMGAFGEKQGQLERPCLFDHGSAASLQFSADLVSRRPLDPSVVNALKVMGLLGGIGSRVRRGYGSLSLVSLTGDVDAWEQPAAGDGYARQLRAAVGPDSLKAEEPPYTAFSRLSRIVAASQGDDPLSLLNDIGKQMQRYRSWGHKGKVDGEPSERNFEDDHDWFKEYPKAGHPRRVVFGLPHNYSKGFGITSEHYDRRGSPLVVHIHKLQNNRYIGVISILRAKFLPDGEKLKIHDDRRETPRSPEIDWKVLDGFIDGVSKNTGKHYFPNRRQVLP
jgi:CRISPR-associated protein Cmr1